MTAMTQSPPRFRFGANWRSFAELVDEGRIHEASASLSSRLGDISGMSFLDAGCGSGLFSLAAVRLGAARARSFDIDPESVDTALSLQQRFEPTAGHWAIERGDILDREYVDSLGEWDIVYSWGVLHHTGDMVQAWAAAARPVAPGGRLFVSIYNDEGSSSVRWSAIKWTYQRVPARVRPVFVLLVMAPRELRAAVAEGPVAYVRGWRDYKTKRGMSRWHDLVDWVGGYPFDVAKPEEVLEFFRRSGFTLEAFVTSGVGSGCNEFVFRRANGGGTEGR